MHITAGSSSSPEKSSGSLHWPPFHFGCRTTVRAIYDPAELEEEPLTEVPAGEEPAKGFGVNPLSSGNWWRELKSMAARAEKYGVQGEISRAKDVLVARKSLGGGTLLIRYGKDMRGDFYWKRGVAYYSPSANRIYLNILAKDARSEALGYTANTAAMLHEWGHWLDQNMTRDGKTLRERLPKLRKFLRKDAIDYINRLINPKKGIKSTRDIASLPWNEVAKVREDLKKDGSLKNGISDIFGGLTRNKITGSWAHPATYWKGDKLEGEAVAHFFEAMAAGGKKLEILKAYFPSAFAYFEEAL